MEHIHIPQELGAAGSKVVHQDRSKLESEEFDFVIRKARITDVREILDLLNGFAASHLILPRGPQYLFENIRDFVVATNKNGNASGERGQTDPCEALSRIVACGSLHVLWEDLAEVRSLVVRPEFQRCGLGSRLVEHMEEEARGLCIKKLFAFTLTETFFKTLGFERKSREDLPEKLWGECSWCPKYFKCDEIGMILEL